MVITPVWSTVEVPTFPPAILGGKPSGGSTEACTPLLPSKLLVQLVVDKANEAPMLEKKLNVKVMPRMKIKP